MSKINPWTLAQVCFVLLGGLIVLGLIIGSAILEFGGWAVARFFLFIGALIALGIFLQQFGDWFQRKEAEWDARHHTTASKDRSQ